MPFYAPLALAFSATSAVLLVLVSVSVPVWDKIYFLRAYSNETVAFGVWGSTLDAQRHISIGYRLSVPGFDDKNLNTPLFRNLSRALILHPIAGASVILAFLCGLPLYNRVASVAMALFAAIGAVVCLLAFLFDMVLFGIARNALSKQGIRSVYGPACWLTLSALLAIFCREITYSNTFDHGFPTRRRKLSMPNFNITLEDSSPQIVYSVDWRAGTTSDDDFADHYSDSSFTLTQVDGATATFMFNGTAVTIFGAKRPNHGQLQVTIDGNSFPSVSGQGNSPGQFQVPLFASPLLDQGIHTVSVTNQGTTFLDIDFVTVQYDIGQPNEPLLVTTVQDTDLAFSYSPQTSWGISVPSVGTYSGSSGHGTATPGAFMVFEFEADSVFLYGPVGPQQSPFGVSLDGAASTKFSANKQFYKPQTLLYSATNLGAGKHHINVTYEPSQPNQILAIDFAQLYTTQSLGGTSAFTSEKTQKTSSASLSGGVIAGIIIALLFVLFVLAALIFLIRRRKQRKDKSAPPMQTSQDVPAAFMYSGAPQPQLYPSTTEGSYYPNRGNLGVDTQSRSGRSGASESEFSPTSHYGAPMAVASNVRPTIIPPLKGQPPLLPDTAGRTLGHVPESELRANRRVVEGRPQDFGAVLPPDYVQATEAYSSRI
ncbi:hypothetical protein MKEN_00645200 [Mycena kentingensis (nom. inval.)]|nr:hypothetical protein MKEN_00645200 [Mycena kentingensis (nom. inval.)]